MSRELSPEVEALREVPFFEDLTSEDLERIAAIGVRQSFQPGDTIVAKDEAGAGVTILAGVADRLREIQDRVEQMEAGSRADG